MNKFLYLKAKTIWLATMISIGAVITVKAQSTALGSIHYQNQYLINPAMAGKESGLVTNILYSKQLINLPGAPTTKIMTLSYKNEDKRIGLGLNLMVDKVGIIDRTRLMGTYAYHLPINEESKLRFGLSLGFMKERISNSAISEASNDITLIRFNERPIFIDGDFGMSYEYKGLQAQAIIPNLRSFFSGDNSKISNVVNHVVSTFALTYKFELKQANDISIAPTIMLNQIKGFDNILDVGLNTSLKDDKFSLLLMYHSTKNASIGLGTKFNNNITLNAIYRTSPVSLGSNSNGNMEIGLSANLFKFKNKY